MSGIELSKGGVRLGETDVLHDVTLSLPARSVAIIGDNGSGKSTLARLIAGLVPATSGTVRVLGLDPARQGAELRRRVAVIFSNPDAQIVMPTVRDDVAFSLRAEKLSADDRATRVTAALERFGLADLADRSCHDLSGGQKQLLALCGAFVRRPELVIADEPTAYLDARNARLVADHLLAGTAHRLVLVTHDLALARRCDTAVLVDGGRVAATGQSAQTVDHYERMLRC
ncbi:ABC transporter related protein [Xylanimonas cellulosilytica DSM 15894]|uniref:ABC transporter related protein n=1 Tax=Xylanimonas cellulosilytica (strain DSM 15894 / JCM 12276 / CECT 5975 / KCTC 9989 / LMG 20990 / NBRC 107835 / XIL07) TaxID=446471 RepID=D1BZU8_XYLCX|nr:ABC transporter ATP-binding protein [Xylanimonas cellulosilytica]ACZ32076.1 ABC transporter related protein [Xylanimonas cellulosilytica DSM 15894]